MSATPNWGRGRTRWFKGSPFMSLPCRSVTQRFSLRNSESAAPVAEAATHNWESSSLSTRLSILI